MTATLTPPAPQGKRERAKAANRDAILEAARAVFAELGYEATNIRDIIRRTDLAAGTFYNYFRSKEEVFEAIADDSAVRFRPLLADIRATATNFPDYLEGAYRAYFSFLAEQNEAAIAQGAPHMALIGVRIDTPEMQAVSEEIRSDIERILDLGEHDDLDLDYCTAAAIGIAREMGDHMLKRRPIDVDGATRFASSLVLKGVASLR